MLVGGELPGCCGAGGVIPFGACPDPAPFSVTVTWPRAYVSVTFVTERQPGEHVTSLVVLNPWTPGTSTGLPCASSCRRRRATVRACEHGTPCAWSCTTRYADVGDNPWVEQAVRAGVPSAPAATRSATAATTPHRNTNLHPERTMLRREHTLASW